MTYLNRLVILSFSRYPLSRPLSFILPTTSYLNTSLLANRQPTNACLGFRPYDPVNKSFGAYQWMDYQTVQKRSAAFGVGLAELHKQIGHDEQKYGIGLWCQNRPEWQITGEFSQYL